MPAIPKSSSAEMYVTPINTSAEEASLKPYRILGLHCPFVFVVVLLFALVLYGYRQRNRRRRPPPLVIPNTKKTVSECGYRYPWTSPPQPLPSPTNHPFFTNHAARPGIRPLPVPTIRRHSYQSNGQNETSRPCDSIEYTRRVSTSNIRSGKILRGEVLQGKIGNTTWRRNQWIVQAG